MPALNGAFALDERHDGAVLVGEQLDLDMPRACEAPLEIDRRVAKRGARLGAGRTHRAGQLGPAFNGPHALSATARDRLDEQRVSNRFGKSRDDVVGRICVDGSPVPGTTGTPARWAARRAAVLLPMRAIASGVGPTKVMPASRTARANASFSDRNP